MITRQKAKACYAEKNSSAGSKLRGSSTLEVCLEQNNILTNITNSSRKATIQKVTPTKMTTRRRKSDAPSTSKQNAEPVNDSNLIKTRQTKKSTKYSHCDEPSSSSKRNQICKKDTSRNKRHSPDENLKSLSNANPKKKRYRASTPIDLDGSGLRTNETPTSRSVTDKKVLNLVEQMKMIRTVLGYSYMDVAKRLNVDYPDKCFRNFKFCQENHSKKNATSFLPVDLFHGSESKELISQNRYPTFLRMVMVCCLNNTFPGVEAISALLALIMNISKSAYKEYSVTFLIQRATEVIFKILFVFPPCLESINELYKKLLIDPIDTRRFLPNKSNSRQSFFVFILKQFNQQIKSEDNETDSENNENDLQSSQLELELQPITTIHQTEDRNESQYFNFHEWQAKKSDNLFRFDIHSRESSLDRLFIVLNFFVKILELDLANWMHRHTTCTSQIIFGSEAPIASRIFFRDIYSRKSELIQNVLQIFIDCCIRNYPEDRINAFGRLISVLANVTALEDVSSTEISFPTIGTKTKEFAKEIYRTALQVEVGKTKNDGRGFNTQFMIVNTILRHIPNPQIRFVIADQLLRKLDSKFDRTSQNLVQQNSSLNVEKIFEYLKKFMDNLEENSEWLKDTEIEKQLPDSARIEGMQKYPKIASGQAKALTRSSYLKFLLDTLTDYCEYSEISKISYIFEKTKLPPECNQMKVSQKSPNKHDKTMKLDLIEKDIELLIKKVKWDQKLKRIPNQTFVKFEGVKVNDTLIMAYVSDIKFLYILQKNIKNLFEEFLEDFNPWLNFIARVLRQDCQE